MSEIIIPPAQRVSRELIMGPEPSQIDLAETFGNTNPVELEIGIGKGFFLQKSAEENAERNYIGIEYQRKYMKMALERIEKRPLPNARVVCGEAFLFLEKCLKPASLNVIHVYFPDPWPKKRHHKRRLFCEEFMAEVHRVLIPNGELLIATDHADYWEWISEVLDKQTYLTKTDRLPQPVGGTEGLTNYEIKYQREGRPIYRVGLRKPQ